MKAFVILLLSASSVLARPFGDDNPSGEWLPVPDNFNWPRCEGPPPEFNPEWKKFNDLPEAQRVVIMRHWPDDKNPERIEVAEADLNNDGRPELFLGIPDYSGTGGTFYEISSRRNGDNYTSIGHFQGAIRFLVRKNGYYQIEVTSRGGGGHYTRSLKVFGSEGYVITRKEDHNFNSGKVTVRESRVADVLTAELSEAFSWHDNLGFPNTIDLPYVQVVRESGQQGENNSTSRTLAEGFLVQEDAEGFTVFISGVSNLERQWWLPTPYAALTHHRFIRKAKGAPECRVNYENLDLKVVAEDVLARARAAAAMDGLRWGRPVTCRVQMFAFARECLRRSALQDQATALLQVASEIPRGTNDVAAPQRHDRNKSNDDIVDEIFARQAPPTFVQILQQELGDAILAYAESRFADPKIPWEDLVKHYERFEVRFPANRSVGYALEAEETLRSMIADRLDHRGEALDEVTPAEQAAEHIRQLPDLGPCRWAMYEPSPIHVEGSGATDVKTPVHRLVDLGEEAVPQLIAALNDRRFTRSTFNFIRPSPPKVMRVADFAERILAHLDRLRAGAPRGGETRSAAVYEQLHLLGQWPSVVGDTSGFRRIASRVDLEFLTAEDAGQLARCYMLMACAFSRTPDARMRHRKDIDPEWALIAKLKELLIKDREQYHRELETKYNRATPVPTDASGPLVDLISFARHHGPKSEAAVKAVEEEVARWRASRTVPHP